MEKRMYMFVPYNISQIQAGIQAGHAALEYANKYGDTRLFNSFMKYKTWIILNGGTTRNSEYNEVKGDMNLILDSIEEHNKEYKQEDRIIKYSTFYEPDLNFALSAICFICDERVFDYERYPDISQYAEDQFGVGKFGRHEKNFLFETRGKKLSYQDYKDKVPIFYKGWEDHVMDGPKNVFLRELLKGKKLFK